jgi:hypothetical protein
MAGATSKAYRAFRAGLKNCLQAGALRTEAERFSGRDRPERDDRGRRSKPRIPYHLRKQVPYGD